MTKCCKMITEPLYSKFQSESNMMIIYVDSPPAQGYSLVLILIDRLYQLEIDWE